MREAFGPVDPTVLLLVPVSNLAGVARHIIDLARVGIPGWRMVISAPEGPLLEEVRALGRPVLPVEIDALPLPRAVLQVRDVIKRVRPAVVHTHLARADILATIATVGLPTRLVTTEHHIPPDRFMFHRSLPAALAMEIVHHVRLRAVAQAMAVSGSTKRDMLRWWKTKAPITVVLNGVDRPSHRSDRPAGRRFLSLTRLSPEKDVAATIRAFALVASRCPDASLTVAGDGPEAPRLRRLSEELGLGERIDFPGFIDPVEAMLAHDVIVQPSRSDNCSYTLLDALAHGMGIAASPIGGNPEILPGHCIAPFDDDEALAEVMLEQADHPRRRPTLPDAVPTVAEMAAAVARVYGLAVES